jgi:PAS domain S-box-containing protein
VLVRVARAAGPEGGIVASFVDVSDLVTRAETLSSALKEAEDYRRALERSSILSITDPSGRIIRANDRFCEIAGYRREELLGKNHRIVNSGYHPRAFMKELWDTINAGRVWNGELRNQTKDGAYYWVDTTIIPFLDESGRPVRFIAIRDDISQRVEARERLEASEKRFRRLFERAPVGIAIADLEERIIAANPALARLLDCSLETLSGRRLEDFAADGDGDAALVEDRELVVGRRESCTRERRLNRADGSVAWARVTTWILPTSEGASSCLIKMVQDTSREREAAEQLRAQASLARLGEMAAVVAHEVKNPLAGIGGALHVIRDRLEEGAVERSIIDEIQGRLMSLNSLVDGLVKFARPITLEMCEVSLTELLGSVAREVKDERLGPGAVRIELHGQQCEIMGDPRLLAELFGNLVRNGGRAMQPKGGTVRVSMMTSERGCTVLVSDAGPGLSPELRQRIFDPFFTSKNQGVGLGLAQSRRIARAHNATLEVVDGDGPGTTLQVVFTHPRVDRARGRAALTRTLTPATGAS